MSLQSVNIGYAFSAQKSRAAPNRGALYFFTSLPACYLGRTMTESTPANAATGHPVDASTGLESPTRASLPEATPAATEPRLLDPRVRILWWIDGVVNAFFMGGLALAADIWLRPRVPLVETLGFGWVTAGVFLFFLTLGLAIPPIRYKRWKYALRPDDLWIRRGVLYVTVSIVPYRRLQFVDTRQGPVARMVGLSELVVHTAAPGTSGTVPGLDAEEAEALRERLAALDPDDEASV